MNIIVAADKNWAIGKDGKELVSIPEDKKMFREETLGKVIVMGRKTFESLPGGQPLYGRTNVVLTSDTEFNVDGVKACHTFSETLDYLKKFKSEDIFIIGGESIYNQFLPYCDVAHVTAIDYEYHADTFFHNLSEDKEWVLAATGDEATYFDLCYEFRMYLRKNRVNI